MIKNDYNAEAIEVLSGLDPVRKRPGMYTDTTRPNHLAQEIIDNSVDEALEGFASYIKVTLHKDQSLKWWMMAVVCRPISIQNMASLVLSLS